MKNYVFREIITDICRIAEPVSTAGHSETCITTELEVTIRHIDKTRTTVKAAGVIRRLTARGDHHVQEPCRPPAGNWQAIDRT